MASQITEYCSDDDFPEIITCYLKDMLQRCDEQHMATKDIINNATESYHALIQSFYQSMRTETEIFDKSIQIILDNINSSQRDLNEVLDNINSSQRDLNEVLNIKSIYRKQKPESKRNYPFMKLLDKKRSSKSCIRSSPSYEIADDVEYMSTSKKQKRAIASPYQKLIRKSTTSSDDLTLSDVINGRKLRNRECDARRHDVVVLEKENEHQKRRNYVSKTENLLSARRDGNNQSRILSKEKKSFENGDMKKSNEEILYQPRRSSDEEKPSQKPRRSSDEEKPSQKLSKVPSVFPVWLEIVDNFTKQNASGRKMVHYNSYCKYCARFSPDNPWAKTKPRRDFGYAGPRHEATEDHTKAEGLYLAHQETESIKK
jgi:hypothetical protein